MRLKAILPLAANDEFRELGKARGAFAQRRQRLFGLRQQLVGARLRPREAEQAGVRGLVVRAVLARRLAECGGVAFLVEDVVDHLEREADTFRVAVEPLDLARAERGAAVRAE